MLRHSDVFYAWLAQDLLPKISKDAVIVMDNASFHKRADMFDAIELHGGTLEFSPAYNPDLNRIEKNGLKLKQLEERNVVALMNCFLSILYMPVYIDPAIGDLLSSSTNKSNSSLAF